jgi:hypothetical protein
MFGLFVHGDFSRSNVQKTKMDVSCERDTQRRTTPPAESAFNECSIP